MLIRVVEREVVLRPFRGGTKEFRLVRVYFEHVCYLFEQFVHEGMLVWAVSYDEALLPNGDKSFLLSLPFGETLEEWEATQLALFQAFRRLSAEHALVLKRDAG